MARKTLTDGPPAGPAGQVAGGGGARYGSLAREAPRREGPTSMMLRTLVRDCLFLNWALPASALPEPASPLRYQLHSWQGEDWVFASAVLFHQEGLHFEGLPLPRLSYPQFNLRL